jgi:hypothetical protein
MEYQPLELPHSKEVILIQPVSPFLLAKLRTKYPAPKPPIQTVNLGTAEKPVWEESINDAHPDHIAAREAWSQELERRMRHFTLAFGARVEWTAEKRAKLDAIREQAARAGEADLIEADDDFAYISYIACLDMRDYHFLLNSIMSSSRPTEEAITEAIATFRPDANGHSADVPGEEHIRD